MHVYVVDREPAGLVAYEPLAHVGFGPAEPGRLRRFITWLGAEVSRRDLARYTRTEAPSATLVLIDGWKFLHHCGGIDQGESDGWRCLAARSSIANFSPAEPFP